MTERWIKLRLHPEHRRVHELAAAMGVSPNDAFAMAVRWLRHLDLDTAAGTASYPASVINAAVQCPSETDFAKAAHGIGWLNKDRRYLKLSTGDEPRYRVRDHSKYLADRHAHREYMRKRRASVKSQLPHGEPPDQTKSDQTRTERALNDQSDRIVASQGLTGLDDYGKACRMVQILPIAKHNKAKAMDMLKKVDKPYALMQRLSRQVVERKLTPSEAGGYVFNAIKSQAG